MSLSLYSITMQRALSFITDGYVSIKGEVGPTEKGIAILLKQQERAQVVLSRGQGKEKVWQGLAGVAMAKTEGFNDQRLEDAGLA